MKADRVVMADMLVPLATTEEELRPLLIEMRTKGLIRQDPRTGWESNAR